VRGKIGIVFKHLAMKTDGQYLGTR